MSDEIEAAITAFENDLKTYRTSTFGHVEETPTQPGPECDVWNEKVLCMARWTELLPTDGTHIEVVHSATSAADQFSRDEVESLRAIQGAASSSTLQDIELKKKAVTNMKKEVDTHITIAVDGGGE